MDGFRWCLYIFIYVCVCSVVGGRGRSGRRQGDRDPSMRWVDLIVMAGRLLAWLGGCGWVGGCEQTFIIVINASRPACDETYIHTYTYI
jgi:hypothetical protein